MNPSRVTRSLGWFFASESSRFISWIFAIALGIRLVMVFVIGDAQHPKMYEHGEIAHNLAIGNGFTMHWPYEPLDSSRIAVLSVPIDHEGAFIPPLNPYIIYSVYLLFGERPTAVMILMILQAIIGALAIPLLYKTSRLLSTDATSRVVALIGACYIPAAIAVTTFSGSVVYQLIALAVLYFSFRAIRFGSFGILISLGLWSGLLTTIRSEFMLLGIMLVVVVVFVSSAAWVRSHRIAALASVLIPMMAVMMPWTIRNYRLFDRIVPTVSHPWFEIWRGNNIVVSNASFLQPTYDWVNPREFPDLVRHMDSIPYDRHFEPAVNDMFMAEAKHFIFSSPAAFVRLGLKKLLFFFTVDLSDRGARSPLYIILTIPVTGMIVFGLWQMLRDRSRRSEALIPTIIGLYYAALTVMTYTLPRYQIFLVLLLLPCASVAIERMKWFRSAERVAGGVS
ncbi:MAG: glycosyltransferase family 39 protein [Bacteroidetes bacterium]|nr:glycosyltransferase family 39 protein [Bacteroidota bacterium]